MLQPHWTGGRDGPKGTQPPQLGLWMLVAAGIAPGLVDLPFPSHHQAPTLLDNQLDILAAEIFAHPEILPPALLKSVLGTGFTQSFNTLVYLKEDIVKVRDTQSFADIQLK